MTQTTTTPGEHPMGAAQDDPFPIHPADVLLNLIVLLLAPMFIEASGGNIAFARMAALETVNAYQIRHNADLISVAQIIAFGLAALGSLSLSMADDISLSMTLRLRGNANALNRSAEQNRRALQQSQCDNGHHVTDANEPSDADYEASAIAAVAAVQPPANPPRQPETTPSQTSHTTPTPAPSATAPSAPAPAPSATAPSAPAPAPSASAEQPLQTMWANAMAKVAAEVSASMPGLPPAERRAASIRAAALSSTASDLLAGNVPPRLRPGALGAMIPPKTA